MAKDNIALLNEIAGQLRKLNQNNIRETLRTKEFQDRQEAIMAGQPQAEDQGPLFVDAAEDFRRRVKGSVAGAKVAESITESGKRAIRENKGVEEKRNKAKSLDTSQFTSEEHLLNILNLLKDWKQDFTTGARNAARDAAENKLEGYGRGMHPNSIATRIKPGFGIAGDPLEDKIDIPKPEKENFITRNIKKVVAAVAIGGSMAISDVIRGYKRDGIDGAVSSFLGGSAEGSMANSIRQSFSVGATGAAAGFMVGGPVGALVGGIGGMALGAMTGFLGEKKINSWMDEAGKNIKDAYNDMKESWGPVVTKISNWLYTPGEGTAATGGFKSKMFGGLIEWNPAKQKGETLSDAWKLLVQKMSTMPGRFAEWLENDLRNAPDAASRKLADFLFGKTDAAKATIVRNNKFDRDNFLMNPEEAPGYVTKQRLQEQINAKILAAPGFDAKGDYIGGYVGVKSKSMNEHINMLQNVGNVDPAGKEIKTPKISDAIEGTAIEGFLDNMRTKYLDLQEYRRLNQIETIPSGYQGGGANIINGQNDQSTTVISTTINNEKKPGARAGFGASVNSVMGEDGFIYSW